MSLVAGSSAVGSHIAAAASAYCAGISDAGRGGASDGGVVSARYAAEAAGVAATYDAVADDAASVSGRSEE